MFIIVLIVVLVLKINETLRQKLEYMHSAKENNKNHK